MVPRCLAQASCALLALLHCATAAWDAQGSNEVIGRVQELEQQLTQRLLSVKSNSATTSSSSSSSSSTSNPIASEEFRSPATPIPTSRGFSGTAPLPAQVLLSYYAQSGENSSKLPLRCRGCDCPRFCPCESPSGRHVSAPKPRADACWNPAFHDADVTPRPFPRNCPRLYQLDDVTSEGHNSKCSQASDFVPHMPMAMQVFRLYNVTVDTRGIVTIADGPINASDSEARVTHVFSYGGCNPCDPAAAVRSARASRRVRRVAVGVNLAYHWGHKFYHCLVESLPAFFAMAAVLRENPDAAILLAPRQWKLYSAVLEPILGVPLKALRKMEIRPWETVHVNRLYQPVYAPCGWHGLSVWKSVRHRVLLPSLGVPAFNSSWHPRAGTSGVAFSEEGAPRVPSPGLVVLAQRGRNERSLIQSQQIYKLLREVFPGHGVALFKGRMGILEARKMFRRAVILIGAHGAALSNMVFMPSGSSVVEIRPIGYPNTCFNSLASACQIDYHLLLSEGNSTTRLAVDMSELESVLRRIRVGGPTIT